MVFFYGHLTPRFIMQAIAAEIVNWKLHGNYYSNRLPDVVTVFLHNGVIYVIDGHQVVIDFLNNRDRLYYDTLEYKIVDKPLDIIPTVVYTEDNK